MLIHILLVAKLEPSEKLVSYMFIVIIINIYNKLKSTYKPEVMVLMTTNNNVVNMFPDSRS